MTLCCATHHGHLLCAPDRVPAHGAVGVRVMVDGLASPPDRAGLRKGVQPR